VFVVEDGVKIPKTKKIKKTEIVPMVVKTSLFIPMLVSTVQSQQKQIDEQATLLKEQQKQIAEQQAQINALMKAVGKLTKKKSL
jgi:uncharacterized coiled-coil protein SlyX